MLESDLPGRSEHRTRLMQRVAALPYRVTIPVTSVALFLIYLAVAQVSYAFVIPPSLSAVFWLPSGVTFALFLRARHAPSFWPGWLAAIFCGELLVVRRHGIPSAVAQAWSLANALWPLTGALLARRFVSGPLALRRLRDVIVLMALIVVGVVPSALLASLAAVLGLGAPSFSEMALSWAASDALAAILLTPVLLTWTARSPRAPHSAGRLPEAVVLFVALTGLSWLLFHRTTPSPLDQSLPSLLFIFVAWAAIRFGPRATTVAMLILDFVMVGATTRGMGPLATSGLSPSAQLLNLQVLVATLGVLMLLLAAAIEEQRAERSIAEEAVRVRDEFLSVASHELHTPLTSLQLSVQMLVAQKAQPVESSTRLLDVVGRQVQRLTTLIGELLDSTRIREGRMQLHFEDVDLSAVAQEAAGRAAGLVARTGSTLSVHADVPIWGRWDQSRLEQILTNLLSNATKFGAGKPIALTVELETPDVARVVVEDHGIGIPAEHLSHIFERFEQAVAQRHYGGLGLGLYIVRSLVELLGGSITAASTPGIGSTFTVRLPLRASAPPQS
jgi:signal transduction histidine kinase